MANDIDGYGFAEQGRNLARLLADLRELDRAGIERIAGGWERLVGDAHLDQFRAAEQAAAEALEADGRAEEWQGVRESLLGLISGDEALASWRAAPEEARQTAERAVLAAALGLSAGAEEERPDLELLLRPAAAGLPWLVLEDEPEPAAG